MAKMAKQTQTDYTVGGKNISDTAIPLYTNALTQYSDLSSNYQDNLDKIIKKYYSNTSSQSDFLRNYQRAMANTTANNYSATGGGYSSSGQRAYNDQQRYQNDLATRLQEQGITGGQNILNNQLSNISTGIGLYDNAYEKGKNYSDVEQYNYLADQYNSFGNQLASAAPAVGTALGTAVGAAFSAPQVGASLGGALGQGVGGAFSYQGSTGSSNPWTGLATGILNTVSSGSLGNLFGSASKAADTAAKAASWTNGTNVSNNYFSLPSSGTDLTTAKFSW